MKKIKDWLKDLGDSVLWLIIGLTLLTICAIMIMFATMGVNFFLRMTDIPTIKEIPIWGHEIPIPQIEKGILTYPTLIPSPTRPVE